MPSSWLTLKGGAHAADPEARHDELLQVQQNAATTVERVRQGESIEVTVRGRPVARLVPVAGTLLDQLEAAGKLKRGKGDLLDLGPPLKPRRGVELPSVTLARMRSDER